MLRLRLLVLAAVAAAVVLSAAPVAVAAPIPFTVDPAASTFQIGGTFNGAPLTAQSAGSTVVGFAGTLNVDLDEAAHTASSNFSILRAGSQPTDQQPMVAFYTQANYGLATGGASPLLLAVRSMTLFLQLHGATYNAGPPPASQVGFYVDGGTLYHAPAAGGPVNNVDLHGGGGDERVIGPVTLTTQGNVQTLTIPIATHLRPGSGLPEVVADLTLGGQVVATRVVPEPAAGLAAVVGGALLAAGRRRRGHGRRAGGRVPGRHADFFMMNR